jgi:hypothetical protein
MKRFILMFVFICLAASASADHIVLKDEYYLKDVKVVANRGRMVEFKQIGDDLVWKVSSKSIVKVVSQLPQNLTEVKPEDMIQYYSKQRHQEEITKKPKAGKRPQKETTRGNYMKSDGVGRYIVLKDGYVIPDVDILLNKGGIVQYRYKRSKKIYELEVKYIEEVAQFQPSDKQLIDPYQIDKYKAVFQQKMEAIQTLMVSSLVDAGVIYDANKKDPYVAVTCAMLLPSAGHAYAEEWPRGALFLLIETMLFGSMFIPIADADVSAFRYLGAYAGLMVIKGVEIYDAVVVTEEYNESLKQRLKIDVHGFDNGVGMRLKLEY